jgi:hypothetical protein
MHEQTTAEILLRARQQMIELEENADNDTLIGIFKRTAINVVDNHARLISGINNLVINKQEDLCKLERFGNFEMIYCIAVNETLIIIRRQYEELEREKQNLLLEHTSQEDSVQSKLEKLTAEKE